MGNLNKQVEFQNLIRSMSVVLSKIINFSDPIIWFWQEIALKNKT